MKKYIAVLIMGLVVAGSNSIYAVGDIAKGEARAKACMGCHGVDGNSAIPGFPKIAGQNATYIIKQLRDFKSKARMDGWKGDKTKKDSQYGVVPGTMNGQVASLSEEDILNLAAYFSSKKIKPGMSDAQLKALGKKIYTGGNKKTGVPACMGCHGPAGEGNNAALYPAIGGQHAAYTEAQLKHFRTAGLIWLAHKNAKKAIPAKRAGRKNDKEFRMQTVVLRMTDAEIKAVASYLQGLRRR